MTPDAVAGLALVVLAVLAASPWQPPRSLRPDGPHPSEREQTAGGESRRRRHPGAAQEEVDDAVVLDLVRAALAAGADVVSALEAVGDALPAAQGGRYRRAARALRLGSSWDAAWVEPGAVATALAPAWTDGVDPDPLLAHAAETIRRTRQVRAREAAARLGVRLVLPVGLCLLPAFVLLGLVPLLIAAGLDLWTR